MKHLSFKNSCQFEPHTTKKKNTRKMSVLSKTDIVQRIKILYFPFLFSIQNTANSSLLTIVGPDFFLLLFYCCFIMCTMEKLHFLAITTIKQC